MKITVIEARLRYCPLKTGQLSATTCQTDACLWWIIDSDSGKDFGQCAITAMSEDLGKVWERLAPLNTDRK
jgi:hypothetical protein